MDVDPIRCWWKTSAGAVRVGENFTLTLTCAALEGPDVQVVPDRSPLAPATIQLTPFEVVSGTRPNDELAGLRRFFQYEYALRVIDPDAIGNDVWLPPLTLHYRVTSRVSANAALEGRDHSYVLPAQAIRVTSLVPVDATDIRDGSDAGFAEIARLSFRGNVLSIAALTLGGLALLTGAITVAGAVRRGRPAAARAPAGMRLGAIRRRVGAELVDVERESQRTGWTDLLVERAATATRIAGSLALRRPPVQQAVPSGTTSSDGRLVLAAGLRRRDRIAVSSAVTAAGLDRRLMEIPETAHADRGLVEDLRDGLSSFGAALYAEDTAAGRSGLDDVLRRVVSATGRLPNHDGWVVRARRLLQRDAEGPAG